MAAATSIELGVGVDFIKDLGNPGLDLPESGTGAGVLVRGPLRVNFGETVGLRVEPFFGLSGAGDRVEWAEYGGAVRYHSDDHWSMLTQLGLSTGPELHPWDDWAAAPFLGTSVGVMWARHWHSFKQSSGILLDPTDSGIERGGYIDPYTDQLAPTVGVYGGVRLPDVAPFAIEVEAGYNVAFMSSAPLKKARPGLGAVRTAYGLNHLRFGVNLVFPLAKGKKQ